MLFYVVCWTETDGIYSCDHEHLTIREAVDCLIPDGRTLFERENMAYFAH